MTPTKSSADRVEIADRLHSAAIHLLRRVRGQDENSGLERSTNTNVDDSARLSH